ncbi:MAG: hypothetical protein HUU46_22475 [Candidatus Hydrogenedentes bacterium]|nr:hypothetical protein [Candidatus Hydrogenedentota bacterium]
MNEKEKQKLYETISAYIDGESEARGDVECLIKEDANAARLYAELSRLSVGMKALPAPDVHPAFVTRVMAHVRDVREAELATPAWRRVIPTILGAVTAAAMIAIAVWPFWPDKGITAPTERDPLVAQVLHLRNQPDQVLAEDFGALITEPIGGDVSTETADIGIALVADPAFGADYTEVVVKVAALIGENGYDDDADVFASLDSLSETEAEALRAMLADSIEGGNELL